MFGSFPTLVNLHSQPALDPKDLPPPTPINLPRYQPDANAPSPSLPSLLAQVGRSTIALGPVGFAAIGLELKLDAAIEDLVPDRSYTPDFRRWDQLTPDESRDENHATLRPLSTGGLSPGCQVYLERKRELANKNEDAFRTVRRLPAPKGSTQARLGNAYEFFRCLELFTVYWDDPARPPPETEPLAAVATTPEESAARNEAESEAGKGPETPPTSRTSCGQSMPAEFRQTLVAAFVKLVAYDFGCNVSMSRVEPRLHLNSPPGPDQRKSYTACHCHFIFQSPTSREAARAGLMYGPVAAVSVRPTVTFTSPDVGTDQSLDLAREVTAALVTAQHRAREGRAERRFGEGAWWTSKPRWGGGQGGPIGREVDVISVRADEDGGPAGRDGPLAKVVKKSRRNMSIYDSYRMVRPPSTCWDRKVKYETIGKAQGADHDDVFVVSSLFHHISLLRFRVPLRLLDVLDGSPEPDASGRSWGKVQAWRSPWYDLFDTHERIVAMQLLWGVMSYQMRERVPSDATDGGSAVVA
ncbi:uncharacterized protein DCS_01860 [Drechmeria coniospora]|uniref:Uncharacterized protein n=1 Tax=Drechmeria coniospora TaxID=98403 RepID=A0A151GUM7_DRECN|nr:uncharacterized protein DCS_01860 [Drechmeria coniospora]KYK60722.1 uncharacterized protein DCS_01860 [Drechmeria coniospora]